MANITIAEASMMCEKFLKRVYQIQNDVEKMKSPEVITNTAEYHHIETCIRLMARVTEQSESSLMNCESRMNDMKHLIPIMPVRINIPAEEFDHIKDLLQQTPKALQIGGE